MSKCDFNIEIALRHSCSPVNLLHNFRTPFPRNTSGWLLLLIKKQYNMLEIRLLFKKFTNLTDK